MSKKPFDAQQDLINDEAKARAKKIDETAEALIALALEKQLTMNDLHVVLNQLTQQFQSIFLSHTVDHYVSPKKVEDVILEAEPPVEPAV